MKYAFLVMKNENRGIWQKITLHLLQNAEKLDFVITL